MNFVSLKMKMSSNIQGQKRKNFQKQDNLNFQLFRTVWFFVQQLIMSEHYNNLAVYSVFFVFLMFTVNIFLCFLPVPSYFLKTNEVFFFIIYFQLQEHLIVRSVCFLVCQSAILTACNITFIVQVNIKFLTAPTTIVMSLFTTMLSMKQEPYPKSFGENRALFIAVSRYRDTA